MIKNGLKEKHKKNKKDISYKNKPYFFGTSKNFRINK